MANLVLVLLCITYLLLLPLQVESPRGTGDQNVGILITFYVFIAFVALSLILTIVIAYKGGFDWIFNSTLWRTIGVGTLWLGMIGGMFLCMYYKAELGVGNKSTGVMRMLAYLFYYGGLWLPLLMIVAYFSMINPDVRFALSPNGYKTFLVLCSVIGFITIAANAPIRKLISSNSDAFYFNLALKEIEKAKTVEEHFWLTTKLTDDSLLTIVYNKIKDQPNLEDELIRILMLNNQFIFSKLYDYMYNHSIERPERLLEPINLNLTRINTQIQGTTLAPWVGVEGFEHVKIEPILRVMYKYFGENREPFRANMLAIKHTLETPKERNQGNKDTKQFMEILSEYKLEVEKWLDGQ